MIIVIQCPVKETVTERKMNLAALFEEVINRLRYER